MLSGRTRALLIELVSMLHTHTEIRTFFLKYDLQQYFSGGNNKEEIVRRVFEAISAAHDPEEADRMFRRILKDVLEGSWNERGGAHFFSGDWPTSRKAKELVDALPADGLVFQEGQLVPTTPRPAEIAPEISALQIELESLGLTTAGTHYQQAVDNYQSGNWEASNGQLRSFLEDLYIELCRRKTSNVFADGQAAIQALQNAGLLEPGEFNLARGLFEMSNGRGAHRGLSDPQEALFRLHFSTALARYLIARIR